MSRLRVPVGFLAVVMGGGGVLLGLVMLTGFVVVSRLVVMVGRCRVVPRRLMMMLARRMFSLISHYRPPSWY